MRHILVQYVGAQGTTADVKRSRASADSLAAALDKRLAAGEDFAALARQYSDDASAEEGGEIMPLQPGETPPDFERTAFALKPGQRSPVFESPYGFHIVERRNLERVAAQHILIRYRGAKSCPDSIQRVRAEALALAQKILERVSSPQASFPVAASIYSEDASAYAGGYLGSFMRGKMDPAFDQAVFALRDGEISGVVETPYGFHIIRRVKEENVRVCHILITHAGAEQPEGTQRGREEALQRARDVLFRVQKGEDFAALAREYSEDRNTAKNGGRLPLVNRGQMVPEFEEAAFSLRPGQAPAIVETKFGFHVVKRLY